MRAYFARAIADARLIEVRHFDGPRIVSGLFNDVGALERAIAALDERGGSTYTTLNSPREAKPTNAMNGQALCDQDIDTIVRLPFDFDAVRPRGVSATEDELLATKLARNRFVMALSVLGFPAAAFATSGNGSHALYRCRLPASTETRDMLTTVYRGLQQEFSTEQALFDPSVRNPSRIWRAYGTTNRKGTPTEERPHRVSTVSIPARWEGVSRALIEALANRYARTLREASRRERAVNAREFRAGAGDYSTLDVVGWFTEHGLYKRHLAPGKHAVCCPWVEEHSSSDAQHRTDSVIWEADEGRWPSFHCSHAHCDRRSILDVMRLWGDADSHCSQAWKARA